MTAPEAGKQTPTAYLAISAQAVCEALGLSHRDLRARMAQHGYEATGRGTVSNIFSGKRQNRKAWRAAALAMGFHPSDLRLMVPADDLDDAA